ncbi:MAG: thioredoxin fold domain-containing protein [Bacteroidetes bacterium]|nr:thioredoxin fold domain-containing protein [Bacteroidota bacterium]
MKQKIFPATLISFLFFAVSCNAQQTNLSVDEFEKAIAQKNIQLLDVRTPGEYQSGHLKNTLQADWNNPAEFKERVKALDKSKPVYTYCLSGARSNAATKWLIQNGFTAYNLQGGITAWKSAGKPVEGLTPVKQISMKEYLEKIPQDKTVLVDFSAVWCPPCKAMEPVIDSLEHQYGNKFLIVKIDGGTQTGICKELNVEAFPTFLLYKNGKETWRKQGMATTKEFLSVL